MNTADGLGHASDVDGIDADRQEFRTAALEWAEVIQRRHRPSADPEIERMHELSKKWFGLQKVRELLMPLLAESEPLAVRVSAAAHLYRHGVAEVEPLVREMAENTDEVLTGPARVSLQRWAMEV